MIDIFSELDKKFNIVAKTKNLSQYLNDEQEFNFRGNEKTFFELFAIAFHKWPLNDNYANLESMVEDLEIATITKGYDDELYVEFVLTNEIQCYKFLQLVKNAVKFMKLEYKTFGYNEVFDAVENKIDSIVQKANLDFILDQQKGYYKLIENKPMVRQIAEQTNEEIAYRLYEYNALENKMNKYKKKEILFFLATYTESITKSYKKSQGDIHDLYDSLDFALNKFNVRHDNTKGKKKVNYTSKLTDVEQINLYDKIYDLFLGVLNIQNTTKSLKDIMELKRKFDTKELD